MDEPAVLQHLRRWIEERWETMDAPGIAVGLTARERVVGVVTHGHANLAARIAVTPSHLFQIGSISKSFTAVALLQEHQAGRLDLHAPVTEYLPWFAVRSPYAPITVHHLLTHSAGVTTGRDFTGEAAHEVWSLREQQVGFAPGERYHYSNAGYKALGLILEAVAGHPWWAVIRSRILEPLGMIATDPITTHETRRRLAVGYVPFYDDRPWHVSHAFAPATWVESATADGTICSTAEEMIAYLRMLLNRGGGPVGRILSEEGFDLLTQRAIEDPEHPRHFYGYGLAVGEVDGRTRIHHTGSTIGYSAWMAVEPAEGVGAVVLANANAEREACGEFALATLRAAGRGEPLPEVPLAPSRDTVGNAAEYAGMFASEDGVLVLVAEGTTLLLQCAGERISLEPILAREDSFIVPHRDFELFPLRFEREDGVVTHAVHGGRWWGNDRYTGLSVFESRPEWDAIVGHYRSHDPWYTNFRIVFRRGGLRFIWGWGQEDWELAPLEGGDFRVGSEEWSPRRIRFDTLIDNKATRAIFDCAPYYRTFTP